MADDEPTHVIAEPGDKNTLCGLKKDGYPRVAAFAVEAHVKGRGMVVCEVCAHHLSKLPADVGGSRDA